MRVCVRVCACVSVCVCVCESVCACVCVCVCVMGVVGVSVCQHKNGKKFVYRNNKWSKYPLWCCSLGMRLKAYLRVTGYQICFSLFKGFLTETHPIPCRVTYLSHLLLLLFLFSTCSANHICLQTHPLLLNPPFQGSCIACYPVLGIATLVIRLFYMTFVFLSWETNKMQLSTS